MNDLELLFRIAMMFPVYDVIEYSLFMFILYMRGLIFTCILFLICYQFCLTFFSSIAEYCQELVLISVTRKYIALFEDPFSTEASYSW